MKFVTKVVNKKLVITPIRVLPNSDRTQFLLKKYKEDGNARITDPPYTFLRWMNLDLPCKEDIFEYYFLRSNGSTSYFDSSCFDDAIIHRFYWNGIFFRRANEITKNEKVLQGDLVRLFYNHLVQGVFLESVAYLLDALLTVEDLTLANTLQKLVVEKSPEILPNGYLQGFVVTNDGNTCGFTCTPISSIQGGVSVYYRPDKIPYSGVRNLVIYNATFPISSIMDCLQTELLVNVPTITGINLALTQKAGKVKSTLASLREQVALSADKEQPKVPYEFIPPQYWGLNRTSILTA